MQLVAEWNSIKLEPILAAAVTSCYYIVLSYMLTYVSHRRGVSGSSRQCACVSCMSQRLLLLCKCRQDLDSNLACALTAHAVTLPADSPIHMLVSGSVMLQVLHYT